MNCFVALDRAPRSIKGAEAELRVDSSLDSAMILFNDVVEIRNRTAATASTQRTGPLQFLNGGWIGRISIHSDDTRSRMARRGQSLLEEAPGCFQIARLREQEVDRGTSGIDGPIEVGPSAGNSDVSFIGTPRAIGGFHLTADALVQFRCIALYPSPNGSMIHRQIALGHQFFQIAITERKPQVPAYAKHNDLVLKMPPLEQRRPSVLHGLLPYQITRPRLQHILLDALAYVHGQGFVHGHIKPANIMGVEDQLKISSDGLCRIDESSVSLGKAGVYDAPETADGEISPASDVWSLGVTLVEALTQRLPVWPGSDQEEPLLPETLPAPFLELTRHCLLQDPQRRWTVADIVANMRQTSPALQGRTGAIPQATLAKRRRYFVRAVALGLVLAAVLAGPRLFNRLRAPFTVVKQPGSPRALPGHPPVQSEAGPPTPTVGLVPGKVVHQVVPDVPRNARDTIRGKVRVGVRVRVDPSGSVVGAKLDSPGPSRYFGELALKAARHWKFDPAEVDGRNISSEWILRFEFGKAGTKVLSARAAP